MLRRRLKRNPRQFGSGPGLQLGRREILVFARACSMILAGAVLLRPWPLAALQSKRGTPGHAASQKPLSEPASTQLRRITIDLPQVYKDGGSVPLRVEVASPMTDSDHVRELHVVAPGNPLPEIARFRFTTHNGRAEVATRIRLDAGLQSVVVTATFSDGSQQVATAKAQVAVGGCST